MHILYKILFSIFLIIGINTLQAQNHPIPFISDRFDPIPTLPDSIPELELVDTWGDSRWIHPCQPIAGDVSYVANDSIIIIGGGDYITGWEAETGLLLWEYRFDHKRGISNMVRSLSISKKKHWVMAANDGNGLFIFNYYTGQLIKEFIYKDQFVFGALSPDGKWVAANTYNLGWKLWNTATGKEEFGQLDKVGALTFSPDSKHFVVSSPSGGLQYKLLIINLKTGQSQNHSLGFNDELRQCQSLQYSPDGKQIALGFWGGQAALWDFDKEQFIFNTKIDANWVDGLSFSNDGKKLLIMGAKSISIWNKRTNIHTEWTPPAELLPCTWEDGRWSKDGEHILLICREWQRPGRFSTTKAATDLYSGIYFSAFDSQLSFSADSKNISAKLSKKKESVLFQISENDTLQILDDSEQAINYRWVNKSTNLASIYTKHLVSQIPGPIAKWHSPPSLNICEHHFGAFTKDKAYYAGIGNDRVIYIYDGKTGAVVAGKSIQGTLIQAVVISPDGKYLAALSWEGLIRLYKLPKLK